VNIIAKFKNPLICDNILSYISRKSKKMIISLMHPLMKVTQKHKKTLLVEKQPKGLKARPVCTYFS